MTTRHFARLFVQRMKSAPAAYVRCLRVEHARSRIESAACVQNKWQLVICDTPGKGLRLWRIRAKEALPSTRNASVLGGDPRAPASWKLSARLIMSWTSMFARIAYRSIIGYCERKTRKISSVNACPIEATPSKARSWLRSESASHRLYQPSKGRERRRLWAAFFVQTRTATGDGFMYVIDVHTSMVYVGNNDLYRIAVFTEDVRKLLADESYAKLQQHLADHPQAGDVIQETGGLRKIRWALPGRGKSGGARVIYYYVVSKAQIRMILIYRKGIKDDLTPKEKAILRKLNKDW